MTSTIEEKKLCGVNVEAIVEEGNPILGRRMLWNWGSHVYTV
jgi:hypothetical protein